MLPPKKNHAADSNKSNPELWQLLVDSLHLGEAGYLKDLLKKNNIRSKILINKNHLKDSTHQLMVLAADKDNARLIYAEEYLHVNHVENIQNSNKKAALTKAFMAGALGAFTGLRIARHVKHQPVYTLLLVVLLGVVPFACAYKYYSKK